MSRLLVDHLRRRARADERVEAGDRAAGDGDEDEREERARDDRAAAADELA